MMNFRSLSRSAPTRIGLSLALCLGIAGVTPAAAQILYDFSLPANGLVGAIDIQWTSPGFITTGAGLQVAPLSGAPITSFSSGIPLNAASSVEGLEVDASNTIIGVDLFASGGSTVLFNQNYPSDFFSFTRTPNQTGTFLGTGNVVSNFTLGTSTPTATLVVTDQSQVPEPTSGVLVGLGVFGVAAWRRSRRRSA